MRFKDKTVLVTGGGTGIGAAIAARFRREGAEVIVMGRRMEPLAEISRVTGALPCAGDAGVAADCERAVALAVDRFGGLDVVVPNAGTAIPGPVHLVDDAAWNASIHANLTSAFMLCRAALPSLMERRGTIVIVSSLAAVAATPNGAGYVVTKHAITGLTRSLARDYGRHGVRVNAICPGWVRTPMADEAMDYVAAARGIDREAAYQLASANVPLGRPGEPDEVAAVCLFLASQEASLVTGSLVIADGGAHVVDVPTLALADLAPAAPR
jgi:meso-butanediol dehydrogenase/(S,S)-butanediol dehydrogenase/diacetyl reductase